MNEAIATIYFYSMSEAKRTNSGHLFSLKLMYSTHINVILQRYITYKVVKYQVKYAL